jgi:hypothetical protein
VHDQLIRVHPSVAEARDPATSFETKPAPAPGSRATGAAPAAVIGVASVGNVRRPRFPCDHLRSELGTSLTWMSRASTLM